ncbi:hypothetical protein WMF30_13855 [Sorangium sp. So ce134]
MLKRAPIMSLLGAAVLAMTSSAWAGWWSSYGAIDYLDTTPGVGYRVYHPYSGNVNGNPASCANTGYFEPFASATATERELMDKTLLSAFLAGRKVKINISNSTCSAGGYPVYIWVQLSKDQ